MAKERSSCISVYDKTKRNTSPTPIHGRSVSTLSGESTLEGTLPESPRSGKAHDIAAVEGAWEAHHCGEPAIDNLFTVFDRNLVNVRLSLLPG